MNITLDREYDLKQETEKISAHSNLINIQLAEEILAILREIEMPLYNSDTQGNRYIDLETEPIPYEILRKAGESEPARLIKNKRRLDFMQFAKPVKKSNFGVERGVKLVFNNPDYQPSKEERELLREWELKIINNFFYPANESYPNFGKFIGSAYEDFFDVDDITLEIRRNGFGEPIAIHLQDPIIYKPVVKGRRYSDLVLQSDFSQLIKQYEQLYNESLRNYEQEQPDYLLIYRGQKIAGATNDVVRKFHFFTRSMFQKAQRGYSINEQAIRMITYILNALKMNASNFTNSRLPLGFFAFTGGGINSAALEKLKKVLWANMQSGTSAARIPMVSLTGDKVDAKWIGVRNTSREMEYHQFMTLLFSIYCQLSGTDPREVSLGSYGDAVGRSTLFEQPTDGIIRESRDSGARTFLMYLADCLNAPNRHGVNIFQELTGMDIKLEFTGFEIEDKQKRLELQVRELQTTKSINDLLAEQDIEKQELKLGDVNIYDVKGLGMTQVYQSIIYKMQQDQQQQQMQQQMQMQGQGQRQGGEEKSGEDEGGKQGQELTEEDKRLLEQHKDAEMDDETRQLIERLSNEGNNTNE